MALQRAPDAAFSTAVTTLKPEDAFDTHQLKCDVDNQGYAIWPKKKGGLGFRYLHLFNMAMLCRQAWRLLSNPDSLCGRVLKAKYFPYIDVTKCTPRPGISYTWRSILSGVQLLKEGLIWRIGNCENVNIWEDPWLPRDSTRKPISPRGTSLLTKVCELINPVNGEWDEQLIHDTFWPEDAAIILQLPIDVEASDCPAWHYDAKGVFSVKSAYKVAVARRDTMAGQNACSSGSTIKGDYDFNWYRIWQLQVPNKVKMFIWRLTHNSLPVRRNVARRGVQIDTRCPVCLRLDEDCGHLFFKCSRVKLCWRFLGTEDVRLALQKCNLGTATFSKIWELDNEHQMKIFVFLWRWWSVRNKVNNGERMQSATEIQNSVSYYLMQFEKLHCSRKEPVTSVNHTWRPPPEGYYKINSDAAYDSTTKSGGWGFVVRNRGGEVLLAGAGMASAIQAEAIAMLKCVQQAAQLNMHRIILEMDASILASAIIAKGVDRSPISYIVNQIRNVLRLELSSYIVCL